MCNFIVVCACMVPCLGCNLFFVPNNRSPGYPTLPNAKNNCRTTKLGHVANLSTLAILGLLYMQTNGHGHENLRVVYTMGHEVVPYQMPFFMIKFMKNAISKALH